MEALHNRQQGTEARFTLGQDFAFRAGVRRARAFGLWVAERGGFAPDETAAYAQLMVDIVLERGTFLACLERADADLAARGIAMSRRELTKQGERLLHEALTRHAPQPRQSGRA